MHNRGQLFLMLGLASLIAIEVVGLAGDAEIGSVPAPSDFSTRSLDFEPMSSPPQLTGRPLFRQTRRPPEIPVQDQTLPVEQTPLEQIPSVPSVSQIPMEQAPLFQHKLTAVAITGDEAVAYMIDPASLDMIRLRKGDQIDGWTLHEVFPDAVVLGYGTQERTRLELWADTRKEESSVYPSQDQDAQDDFKHSEGEFSTPDSLPSESPGRPVRGPRSRVH